MPVQAPAKNLSKFTTEVADRCRLSVRQQLLVQSSIINSSGGNVGECSMSLSTVWRQRTNTRMQIAEKIKRDWLEIKPEHVVIHWDSKLIGFVTGRTEERIAVLVSGYKISALIGT